MLLAYICYLAINLRMTPALDDLKTMTGELVAGTSQRVDG